MEYIKNRVWNAKNIGLVVVAAEVPEVDEEGDVAGDVAVARKGVRDDDAHRVVVDGHSDHRVQESLERPVEGRGVSLGGTPQQDGRFFFSSSIYL